MVRKKIAKESVRLSTSFPAEHYESLIRVANDNRVSVAWVVRDAVERYLSDQGATGSPKPQQRKVRQ